MGRLFWKFFLLIFLAQVLTIFAVGSAIWLRTRPSDLPWPPPPAEFRPEGRFGLDRPPPPEQMPPSTIRAPHRPPRHHFPLEPILGGALASLISAAILAWYVTKPIRHLRHAFQTAASGDLSLRVGPKLSNRRDELADLAHDYDHMADQLRALLDGQRRLLHDVSHELRSPLARLQLAIGLAQQQPAQQVRSLERIEREAIRINQLIGELLTLSRIEAGAANPYDEAIDCIALLNDIIDDAAFEAQAEQKTLSWQTDLADAYVVGNAELLRRAFENIIRNALRFSPNDASIEIRADQDGMHWRFVIADHGPGVAASQLAQIFEPFYRGNQNVAGYGLGLAIAKRVIDAHGGQISAANQAPSGLIVEIKLPSTIKQQV